MAAAGSLHVLWSDHRGRYWVLTFLYPLGVVERVHVVATDCGDMLTISHRFSVMHVRRSWRARLRDVKVFKMPPHLCQNAAQATSCADYRRSENTAEPSEHKKVCHLFPEPS